MTYISHLHRHAHTSYLPVIPMTTVPGFDPSFIGAVQDDWSMFSDDPVDYSVGAPIGFGASSIVYSAVYTPKNASSKHASIPCALKVLDLDKLPQSALHLLTRETRLMSLSKHPNVLRVRGSWMVGHRVYIALRLMRKGSVRDVMRYRHIDGVEEEIVKCILKQALQGLNYLHINGFIHRDIKAANLLIDDDGTVLLGDLGVAASLSDDPVGAGSQGYQYFSTVSSTSTDSTSTVARPPNPRPHYGRRKSFVGTPCWMAPEVVAQKTGYNASADIYSLGITALELAHGRAPHSLDPPHKALMKTLQNASPTLDRAGGANKYSRSLKEIIDSCLNKDPAQRPTAEELLALPYFKFSKKKDYLIAALLTGLPPLAARQERRKTALTLTATSVGSSWDFPQSIFAPPSPSPHTRNPSNSSPARRILPSESVFPMDDENSIVSEHEGISSDSSEADDGPPRSTRGRQPPQDASGKYPSPLLTPPLSSPRRQAPVKPALLSPPMSPIMRSASIVPNEPVLDAASSNGRWKKLTGRIGAGKTGTGSPPEKPSSGGSSSGGFGGSLSRTSSRLLGRSKG